MKLFVKVMCVLIGVGVVGTLFIWFNNQVEINYEKNGTYENNLTVSFKHRFLNLEKDIKCNLSNEDITLSSKFENNSCTLSVPEGNYKLVLESKSRQLLLSGTKEIVIKEIEKFEIEQDKVYLIIGESEKLNFSSSQSPITWKYDNEIISLSDGTISGLKDGKTTIIGKNEDGVVDSVDVVVTSLLNKQTNFDFEKAYIGCKQYSNDEAKLLDEFLEYRINKAGYQTRAGVVEAARFLTLSFQYRIPYFFENGRLFWSGVHYIDGEGRYYHKGLYLSEDKYKDIGPRKDGPAMWGCNLKN